MGAFSSGEPIRGVCLTKISKELRGPGLESYRGCQIDGCHDKFKTSTETLNTEIYESVLNRLASAR